MLEPKTKKNRLITFYRISYKFLCKIKNLFVSFLSHFIKNAVETLDLINTSKTSKYFEILEEVR